MEDWLRESFNIQGWATYEEIAWVHDLGLTYDTVVEIGTWKGRMTYALCSANHANVTTIDHFLGTESQRHAEQKEALEKDIYAEFMKNCGHFQNLTVLKMESTEAAKTFQPDSVDAVFLDGDHTPDGFMRDLLAWYPVTKKIICGHDTWMIRDQLDKFFGVGKWREAAFINDGIWYFIKDTKSHFNMWEKLMKKTLFTLDINNAYDKRITDITYPFMKAYADKIGADFHIISERKFPDFPVTYEKCQIYQLGQEMNNDWNIFFDCDALIHPDFMDVTTFLTKDHVAHNGIDLANVRWKYDRFFLRDGRHIGSPSWCCVASDWTIDLFKPIDDMSLAEISEHIFPITVELKGGITPLRLIEDYVFSRNIAKYGLKFHTLHDLLVKAGYSNGTQNFLWHNYNVPIEQKYQQLIQVVKNWGLTL